MFGLNWGELVVIGIVALIAIGPKELPTVLRTLGQWMGKIRRMANEFQSQFNEALREAEFADLKKSADELTNAVGNLGNADPLADTQREIERALEAPPVEAPAVAAADASPPAVAPESLASSEAPPDKAGSAA